MKKKIFITRTTPDIGEVCAEHFSSEGYDRILSRRGEVRLKKLQQILKNKYDISVKTSYFDIYDGKTVFESMISLEINDQDIDILINNAGLVLSIASFSKKDSASWDTMLNADIKDLLYITRVLLICMSSKKRHIVNINSTSTKAQCLLSDRAYHRCSQAHRSIQTKYQGYQRAPGTKKTDFFKCISVANA